MKPYNNFRKTANKRSLASEKLTDLKNFYKSSKYNYKTRFYINIASPGKTTAMKNKFNKKNIHYFYYMNPTAATLEKQLI